MDAPSLLTPESILIDGANAVTGAPRAGFPGATTSLVVAAVVALVVSVVIRRKRASRALIMAGVLGLPGLATVLFLRADALPNRTATATVIHDELLVLTEEAPWPATALQITRDDGDVLFPLARYAWPTRPFTASPLKFIELRGGALGAGCEPVDAGTICGVGP